MLQPSTLTFLRKLKKNNNRDWFENHRVDFLAAKKDFEILVAELLKVLSEINPALKNLEVKDCVFRIYRDVRFSRNKTPYKTNMGAYFAEGGKKSVKAGFYVQAEPSSGFVAAGCWMPEAAELKMIRQEIDYNLPEFEKILKNPKFKKRFGAMGDAKIKTSPKGYDATNPAIEHLRQTSFVVSANLDDDDFTSKNLVKKLATIYTESLPFIRFMNTAMEP